MIPDSENFFEEEQTSENYELPPSATYNIDWNNKRIIGTIDGREACIQFIHKVLSTDKYAFEIYDWTYGNDIAQLTGLPYDYIVARLPKIMKEALLIDDRITDVRDFEFKRISIDSVSMSCTIDTVYGMIKYEQEVPV